MARTDLAAVQRFGNGGGRVACRRDLRLCGLLCRSLCRRDYRKPRQSSHHWRAHFPAKPLLRHGARPLMRTRISRLAGKLRSQPVHATGPRPGGRISSRQRDRVWVKAGSSLIAFAWRTAFRLGFPPARLCWRLTRPRYQGTVVAVYVGSALLLVRSSYRRGWHLPGGGVRRDETPEIAAQRELAEQIGLRAPGLLAVGSTCGTWDGRRDRVNFFELR